MKLEAKLCKELDEVLEQEEILWYQKARIEWIKDGDRNTTFFHLSTIIRRWRNKISALKDGDSWNHDKDQVKALIMDFFSSLFSEDSTETEVHDLPSNICPEFSYEDWNKLTRPFFKSDVDYVVQNLGSLKAPGPDGYQALFY